MEYIFYYISAGVVLAAFIVSVYLKSLGFSNIVIGITTVGYTLVYEIILGDQMGLYYYLDPKVSTLYMVLSALLVYPLLNIVYTLFLPRKTRDVLAYTAAWIIAMLVFEFASVAAGTIVFTGWRPFPWSIVTYLFTYTWIYFFYRYMERSRERCFQ